MDVRGKPGYTKARVGCPRRPQRGDRLGLSNSPAPQPQITPELIHDIDAAKARIARNCAFVLCEHKKAVFCVLLFKPHPSLTVPAARPSTLNSPAIRVVQSPEGRLRTKRAEFDAMRFSSFHSM